MPVETLMNTDGSPVDETPLEQFRAAFHGDIVRPTDATYEDARHIWNAGALKRPGAIARCTGVVDVSPR